MGQISMHTTPPARGNHFPKKSHGTQKELLVLIRKIREDSLQEVPFVECIGFQQVEGGKR